MSKIKPSICIDGGHGGTDRGATFEDLEEAAYVFMMQEKAFDYLAAKFPRLNLTTSRPDDLTDPDFYDRHRIANCAKADLVLSLHIDNTGSKNSGLHFLHWPTNGYTEAICRAALPYIPIELKRKTPIYSANEKWPRARNVLQAFKEIDTIIIEMGWADNDYKALMNTATQNKLMHTIEHMIAFWLNLRSQHHGSLCQ